MKRYHTYKDSGVEWIGEVPEGWKVKKLKFTDTVIMGQSPSSDNYNSNYLGLPFLQGNAEFGSVNPTPRTWSKDANKIVTAGDVLVSVRAPIGAVNIADQVYGIGRGLCGIHPKNSRKKYLYYLFISLGEELNRVGTGSTFTAISVDNIRNTILPIPKAIEQQQIAAYLDSKTAQIDDLISKKQKLIELLKEERAAIINQAVTKGMNPDVPMKDSGIEWLGEVPEHWEVKRLKFLVNKIGSGVTPRGGASVYQNDGIPLLRSQNIHFDGLRLDDVAYISEEIHNEMSGSKVKPNDVVLNITGASIGRCCIVPADFGEANVNQHVCIIRPNRQIESRFLHNYISSNNGQAQIFSSEKGISREGLNFEQLKGFQILVPPLNNQKDITDYIKSATIKIDQTTSKIEKQIGLLKEFRTAIISEVVTGKIDVRDEESK